MKGRGWGTGEIERSDQNDSTRRVVSIRTAHSWAKNANLITLAVYFAAWCWWWFVLICLYEPAPKIGPWLRWWRHVVYVLGTWGRVMGKSWPLWLLPLALQWIKPLRTLNRYNLEPKVKNDNYPPPNAQMDPNTSGFITAENWDARAGVVALEVAQPQEAQLVTLEIVEGDKRRYLTDIEVTPALQQFCRGVIGGGVTFSERGAVGCKMDKAAFHDLRDQMLDRDMIAWKNGSNARSGYHVRPVAWRALAELAALPHSPADG